MNQGQRVAGIGFLIGDTEEGQGVEPVKADRLQRGGGVDTGQQTGLHIICAGAENCVSVDGHGALGSGAHRVNGVAVAQQEDPARATARQGCQQIVSHDCLGLPFHV